MNKKVLLRERKRHTARRVASTPYVNRCEQTENITFPHPLDAGGKYVRPFGKKNMITIFQV